MVSGPFQSGERVSFQLSEAVCPDARELARQLTPELEVSGEIMFLSDHGTVKNRFAIVSVGGLLTPVVVPIDRLRRPGLVPRVTDVSERRGTG